MNNEQKNNGIHSIKETNLVSLIMNLYRILMISKIKKKIPIPNVIFLILFSEKFLVKIKRIATIIKVIPKAMKCGILKRLLGGNSPFFAVESICYLHKTIYNELNDYNRRSIRKVSHHT